MKRLWRAVASHFLPQEPSMREVILLRYQARMQSLRAKMQALETQVSYTHYREDPLWLSYREQMNAVVREAKIMLGSNEPVVKILNHRTSPNGQAKTI